MVVRVAARESGRPTGRWRNPRCDVTVETPARTLALKMADGEDVEAADPSRRRFAKFTISEPTSDNVLIPKEEGTENGLPRVQSKSRFKVARVEFSDEPVSDHKAKDAVPSSERDVNNSRGRTRNRSRQESICSNDTSSPPISPNNADPTYNSHSYDTHNLKTFAHNTLETVPHLDHYRNILSASGNIRKRPTLLELHELEKVSRI